MYLRETTLPLDSVNLTLKERVQEVRLIYQVDVIAPKGGTRHPAKNMQDAIISHFGKVLRLDHNGQKVEINSVANKGLITDGAWVIYPVEVYCTAYVTL